MVFPSLDDDDLIFLTVLWERFIFGTIRSAKANSLETGPRDNFLKAWKLGNEAISSQVVMRTATANELSMVSLCLEGFSIRLILQ